MGVEQIFAKARSDRKMKPQISLSTLLRRPLETAPIFSGERQSMSFQFIGGSRADRRFDHKRGKRMAKRQHKPNWRNYDKY